MQFPIILVSLASLASLGLVQAAAVLTAGSLRRAVNEVANEYANEDESRIDQLDKCRRVPRASAAYDRALHPTTNVAQLSKHI